MRWTFGVKLGSAIWFGLLANIAVGGLVSYRSAIRLIETTRSVERAHSVLAGIENTGSAAKTVETAVRSFLLTGDRSYLEPYRDAVSSINRNLASLRSLTADNPRQQEALRSLATLLADVLTLAGKQVAARANGAEGSRDVEAQISLNREKGNRIRELVDRMKHGEQTLLTSRQAMAEKSANSSIRVVLAGTALALLLGLIAGAVILRNFSTSVNTLKKGAELIGSGNLSHRISTSSNDEFADLAAALNNMAEQLGRARGELSRQAELTAAILHSIGDGVAVIDENGRYLVYNHAACRINGIPEGEFPASISDRYGYVIREDKPCPVPVDEMPLARAARGEFVDEMIAGLRPKAPGEPMRWARVTARPVRDGQGTLRGAVAVMSDITGQRKTVSELEAREHLLRTVLDAMPVGVAIAGADGIITKVNAAGAAIWGVPRDAPDSYGGIKAWRWQTGDPVQPHEWALTRAIQNGETVLQELIGIETPGYTRKGIFLSAIPLRDSSGNITGAIEVSEDITARIRIEEELKRSNKELEAFSYSVSHDLRAPLRHIDGFAGLLQRHAGPRLDEKAQRYLNTISASAKEMGNLIDDLLVFSRMGRAEMMSAPVDMDQMLRDILEDAAPETAGRELEWKISALPSVQGDASMLRLVLVNLISNAIKYTGPRAVARIEIAGYRDGDEAVICVRDNGVGFDMKYSEKLFGVFQRLHSGREFEGTGIGLATVRSIVHRHGGRTWAVGAVDEGAAFYFSLPSRNEESQ
ncbi:MAG: Adaptive-response sensory-kinase SasA [Bryobacteraceae bacterium]|nr:Adaptive-response sensory-kinase SasA [Bryobacteraceae bacterium]